MKPKQLSPVDDPARRIDVHFRVRYAECDLADKSIESNPQLQMYLSSHFVREPESGGVVDIRLIEDDRAHCFEGSLVGSLKREHETISDMACIGLSSYAIHRTEAGIPCYVNVGTSHVRIADVLREIKERGVYDHEHELVMRTVIMSGLQPIKKGVVQVQIYKVRLGHALTGKPLAKSALGIGAGAADAIANELVGYIESTMNFEMRYKDTFQHTERVRAPMDISEVGTELTPGTFLPVSAYTMIEPPRSNAEYWQNALECIMARRGLKPAEYNDLTRHDKAGLMGDMICFGVQSFDYIGDAVNTGNRLNKTIANAYVPGEEFNPTPCIPRSGDCEDLASAINNNLKSLQRVTVDASKFPRVAELQAIAQLYVPATSLTTVHGAQIKDATETLGAHMVAPIFTEHRIRTMLGRCAEGRALLGRLEGPKVVPSVFAATGALMSKDAGDEDMPTLICEGTGHLTSLYYHDEMVEKRILVARSMPSLSAFKKEIPREAPGKPSGFYHGPLGMFMSHFIDKYGINTGSFILGQLPENGAHGEPTRGVLYTDVVTDSPRVALIPHPPMSAKLMAIVREAITLRPPARDLILDRSKPMLGAERDPLLDKYVSAVKSMKRAPPARVPRGGSVDVFVRPHQYDEDRIGEMIRDAQKVDAVYDASYELERVTNTYYIYKLRLFVK